MILYHGVRPEGAAGSDIRGKHILVKDFQRQLDFWNRHCHPISLDTALACLKEKKPFPERSVCLTFDDGYANNAQVAAPLLKQAGIPATFFLTTGFLDGTHPLWVDRFESAMRALKKSPTDDHHLRQEFKRLPNNERLERLEAMERGAGINATSAGLLAPMSWQEARQLANDGFTLGAHTVTHPILSRCTTDEARFEIKESKKRIEQELNRPCRYFAYPNGQPGDWTPGTVNLLKDAGFECAITTVPGQVVEEDDVFALKRNTLEGSDWNRFVLTASGWRSILQNIRRYASN